MIKPVDASGSKGVSKIEKEEEFSAAYELALSYSSAKTVVIEEFLQKEGYQIAGDGFLVDGELQFAGLMNEHFDRLCNPLVPIGESYPSILSEPLKKKAKCEIQRLLQLLGMKMGAVNLDFIVDKTGEVFILEIGPRNGGNLITDAIRLASGVDLANYTIRAALGMDCHSLVEQPIHTYVSSYIVHTIQDGIYDYIELKNGIEADLIKSHLFVKEGEKISRFEHGGYGIGAMLIQHKNIEEMCYRMDHMEEFIRVVVK